MKGGGQLSAAFLWQSNFACIGTGMQETNTMLVREAKRDVVSKS